MNPALTQELEFQNTRLRKRLIELAQARIDGFRAQLSSEMALRDASHTRSRAAIVGLEMAESELRVMAAEREF